jgi:hypothetical protein
MPHLLVQIPTLNIFMEWISKLGGFRPIYVGCFKRSWIIINMCWKNQVKVSSSVEMFDICTCDKNELLVRFIEGQVKNKFNNSIMLIEFSSLSHGV